MQLAILGRQPKLSIAELECLFGAQNITPITELAALVDNDYPLPQARLGGTIKSAKLLTRLEKTDLAGAFEYLRTSLPEHLQYLPEGKLQLGVSVYGAAASRDWLLKQTLSLKKIIKAAGRSVRIIENKTEALEAAQVLYNKLTGPLGWELLLVCDGADILLAQTTGVQNIDDYGARDFGRPKRDAYVGMLPPKLAQIMINLAIGQVNKGKEQNEHDKVVFDPFCGTGVVLQEALLMGHSAYGSDLSQKMIDYSQNNLEWLTAEHNPSTAKWSVSTADATTNDWDFSALCPEPSDLTIVCETYLGQPLTSLPDGKRLEEIVSAANTIAEGFLKNIAGQLKKGTRLCVALPAWYLGNDTFKHLEVLDHLGDLGYNRLDLVHAKQQDLIYHRENQVVARELTLLEKL